MHRGDCLTAITIWAPRLRNLRLRALFSLESLTLFDQHPLAASLPAGFTPLAQQVDPDLENTSLALRANPRIVEFELAEDDDWW
mmetsp:Transcript_16147/g.46520  ORF Transcript_16147/g.46520 Transcript_16147/m.46520 type:complete len:84 (-) Transcript_16147:77-328(-)